MEKKYLIIAWAVIVLIAVGTFSSVWNAYTLHQRQPPAVEDQLSANSQNGLPGIYKVTPGTLPDGEGTAILTDSHGQVIASPSSIVTLNTN